MIVKNSSLKKLSISLSFGVLVSTCAVAQTMRLHLINVGQGAAELYEFPCGIVLVDTGGERPEDVANLVTYLKKVFALRPDLNNTLSEVMLTHDHKDHALGLAAVAQNFTIKNYVDNGRATGSGAPYRKRFLKYLQDNHLKTKIEAVTDEMARSDSDLLGYTDKVVDPLKCDNCDPSIHILAASQETNPGWSSDDFKDENNHSLIVKFTFGKSRFLVSGDAESPELKRTAAFYAGSETLDSDVWTVSHHGSANGVSQDFLDAVSPQAALISCGPPDRMKQWTAWAYGHPRMSAFKMVEESVTLERPEIPMQVFTKIHVSQTYNLKKAIYGTGWDGNVVVEADLEGNLTFKSWN